MPTVRYGNPQTIDHRTGAAVAGQQVTTSHIDPSYPLERAVLALTHADGAWAAHSAAAAPDWVESDDPELAEALAAHWGCPIGCPDDWAPTDQVGGAPVPISPAEPPAPRA